MFKLPTPVLEVALQKTAYSRIKNIREEGKEDYGQELIKFLADTYEGSDSRDVIALLYWVSLFLVDSSLTDVIQELPEDDPMKQGIMKELALFNLMDVGDGEH